MAMKSKVIQFVSAQGLDQRYKGQLGYADNVVNFRVDPNGLGWVCDRGLESWWKYPNPFTIVANQSNVSKHLAYPTDACFVWEKSSTGQVYYFWERGGDLVYAWGNKAQGSAYAGAYYFSDFVYLGTGRKLRKTNEAGTQFIPYGNRLLIINGYDKPIWFSGNEDYRDFSFSIATGDVTPTNIQPSYQSGDALEGGGTGAPVFGEKSTLGLGELNNERSQYSYQLTYITADGAESPLSNVSSVSWIVAGASAEPDEQVRFGVVLELPQGGDGVVARRLYRTKNIKRTGADGANDAVYYFVKQFDDNATTHYIDIIPDSALVDRAPALIDSSRINTTYKFGATWDNRIWLAGGDSTPTRIIYSDKGVPEQFGSFSFFDVGSTQGGHITNIYPYYNNLLVFRRNSIDIIRRDGQGNPTIAALTTNLGTTASNAICAVPNLGVMFLNEEGIYLISGGLDGGSAISIQRMSETLDKEIAKINKAALPMAWACYSPMEREAWFHIPQNGESVPTKGLVYHADNAQWSQRGSTGSNLADELFRFSCGTTDPEGNFIFGSSPRWVGLGGGVGSPIIIGSTGYSVSPLQVWSGSSFYGQRFVVTNSNQDTTSFTISDNTRPDAIWESNWNDFGDNSVKHRVYSVEVEILSYGDLQLGLDYATDFDYDFVSAGGQKQSMNERVFTLAEDPVFGDANPTITKHPFVIGTDKAKDARIIRLRWDVNTQLINQFKFRLKTLSAGDFQPVNTTFHLLSFHINYDTATLQTLNQRTNLQKGQAR
jgi:hypothetical protein